MKSILEQYPDHCNHKLFVLITRAVENLALKRIWKTFIKDKLVLELLKHENIKESDNPKATVDQSKATSVKDSTVTAMPKTSYK